MIDAGLEGFLAAERAAVDAALAGVLDGARGPAAVLDPIRYAVEGGGKRLRPILCVAACRALRPGDVSDAVYRLASALELIHAYSLIHDDLPAMDDDSVRRGRPSTHVVFGAPAAAVAGAALIPLAVRTVLEGAVAMGLDDETAAVLVGRLTAAAGASGMVGGQALDLGAEGHVVDLTGLERIHRMKTGALLAASPCIGAFAAGARGSVLDALEVYGRALGLAFQIMDDILDVTASSAVLGKTAGRDTQMEKATFPALAGLDGARGRAAGEVEVARAALRAVGLDAPELDALAGYAIERDR